jgi:hypothetical protein
MRRAAARGLVVYIRTSILGDYRYGLPTFTKPMTLEETILHTIYHDGPMTREVLKDVLKIDHRRLKRVMLDMERRRLIHKCGVMTFGHQWEVGAGPELIKKRRKGLKVSESAGSAIQKIADEFQASHPMVGDKEDW